MSPRPFQRTKTKLHPSLRARKWIEKCRKWGYEGKASAEVAARMTREQDHFVVTYGSQAIQPYFCHACGFFHVGHSYRKEKRPSNSMPEPETE